MKRRMLTDDITASGKFLRLPPSTQALYMHCVMNTDDDGVVDMFTVMRMVGAKEDEVVLLVEREFVTPLDKKEFIFWVTGFQDFNKIPPHVKEDSQYLPLLLATVQGVEIVKSAKKDDNKRRYAQLKEQRKVNKQQSKSDDPKMIRIGSSPDQGHDPKMIHPMIQDDPNTRIGKDRVGKSKLQAEAKPRLGRESFLEGLSPDTSRLWRYWEETFSEITTSLEENRSALNKLLDLHKSPESVERLMQLAAKAWGDKYTPKEAKASSPKELWVKRGTLLAWGKGKFNQVQASNTLVI